MVAPIYSITGAALGLPQASVLAEAASFACGPSAPGELCFREPGPLPTMRGNDLADLDLLAFGEQVDVCGKDVALPQKLPDAESIEERRWAPRQALGRRAHSWLHRVKAKVAVATVRGTGSRPRSAPTRAVSDYSNTSFTLVQLATLNGQLLS